MKLEISGLHTEISEKLKQHIEKKIGGLEKYIPQRQRKPAHTAVRIKQVKANQKIQFNCEIIIKLPRKTIVVNHTEGSAFAAVDTAETKIKPAIKQYKEKNLGHKLRQRFTQRARNG